MDISEFLNSTHTLTLEIASSPFGSAVNKKDEMDMATNRAIIHDDRKAETLFNRERTLCIVGVTLQRSKS